jgi:TonB family protein
MPTIIQIPLLEEMRKSEAAAANGNGNSSAQGSLFPGPGSQPFDDRLHKTPFALLEDDLELQLERSKLREAFWISLTIHAIAIAIIALLLPRLLARYQATPNPLAVMLQDHQITFLEMPPAPVQKPLDTNKISDQDRRAALRHPDLQQLRELEDARRAGSPGAVSAPAVKTPPPGQPAQQNQQSQAQQSQPTQQQQQPDNNMARLEQPPTPAQGSGRNNPFAAAASPGSVIEQAERASAERRNYGSAGDYGVGPSAQPTKLRSDIDILSDTMGVDFGPYLSRALETIRQNWYNVIPEEARPPLMKSGKVSIEFAILKDGSIAGMRVISPSGDVALDRAAWGGITGSNPFQRLPQEFHGEYLALRIHFFYNPQKGDLR